MAWLALFLCASAAFAQSPTNISVVSGNGQLICQACPFNIQAGFLPLVVKVTDANGNPVVGTTVSWNVTAGGFNGQLQSSSTTTDGNGLSQNTYFPGFPPQGSA